MLCEYDSTLAAYGKKYKMKKRKTQRVRFSNNARVLFLLKNKIANFVSLLTIYKSPFS